MPSEKTPFQFNISEILTLVLREEKRRVAPYKPKRDRRGRTESGVQQKAAGIALRVRRKSGIKGCASMKKGSAKNMCQNMTEPQIDRLATIRPGAEIPKSADKPGEKRKALPKRLNLNKK